MAKQETAAKQDETVEATLKQPHRHRGIEYRPGTKIYLSEGRAKRLSQRKVI